MVLQYTVSKRELDENEKQATDVNRDSQITATDALIILQYSVGKILCFSSVGFEIYEKVTLDARPDNLISAQRARVVRSVAELNAVTADYAYYDKVFYEKSYDDDFFNEYSLVALEIFSPVIVRYNTIDRIEAEGDTLTVHSTTVRGNVEATALSTCIILARVDKSAVSGVKQAECIHREMRPSELVTEQDWENWEQYIKQLYPDIQ